MKSVLALVLVWVPLAGSGCRVENPDHCLHKASNPHAWCIEEFGGDLRYCSPCELDHHGCVAQEPSEKACPAYVPPPMDEGEDETGGSETGQETGSSSGYEETRDGSTSAWKRLPASTR